MPVLLSDEEHQFRAAVRRFAEREIAPIVEECERTRSTPRELWSRMGELGYLGVRYPEELGGSGGTVAMACVLMEELYKVGPGVVGGFEITVSLGTEPLASAGTPQQIDRWLRPALSGEAVAAFGITEPEAGSDAAGIRSKAERVDDGWVLNGSKTFVSNGGIADYILVTARTENGVSLFVVERGDEGFTAGEPFEKMGCHASNTTPLYFDSCILPEDRLIGHEGRGLEMVFHNLDEGRLIVAAESLGIAKAAFEQAVAHAKQRKQFG
ncbi:MAG: hypothetical protein QOF36_1871, partial [Microbacteriaceae bacterium]|nr:hypothetical protein [Microbacteriaceae bacterium]